MSSKLLIIGAIVILIGAGAWYWLSDNAMTEETMMEKDETMMEKEGDAMEKEGDVMMEKEDDSMMDKEDGVMMEKGSYEAYSPEKVAVAGDKKVLLFFYAAWCPICRPLDADITAHMSDIPKNVLILKVNFDTEIALRQKYGVTVQHTIVQVTSQGTLVKKWNVETPTLSAVVLQVK